MMDKKRIVITIGLMIGVLLGMQFAGASFLDNFMDVWESITGLATTGTSVANVTIASITPIIPNAAVEPPATQTITEESYVNVSFAFNATDADGASDLNNRSAYGWINRTGQTTRSNYSCNAVSNVNTTTNRYNCTVQLWYFDGDGAWSINVSINDSGGSRVENVVSTFTVSPTKGIEMNANDSSGGVSWTSINLGSTNVISPNAVIVNNTANVNLTVINITGYNLHGADTPAQFIYAANFSVNSTVGCDGNVLANNTKVRVSRNTGNSGNLSISPGNLSAGGGAQGTLYFCLEALEGPGGSLTPQRFRTANGFPWSVDVG